MDHDKSIAIMMIFHDKEMILVFLKKSRKVKRKGSIVLKL